MGLIQYEYPPEDERYLECDGIITDKTGNAVDFCRTPIVENRDIILHNIDGIYGEAMLCQYVLNCITDQHSSKLAIRQFIDERHRPYRCLVKHIYCKRCLGCVGCYVYYTPNVHNKHKMDMFIVETLMTNFKLH